MRIGLFTDTYPPFINGVSTSVFMLKKALERAGHQVFVVTINTETFHYGYDENDTVVRIPGLPIGLYDYRVSTVYPLKAMNIIRKWKLDVIHSHTEFSVGTFARFISRQFNIPLVHTYHTLYEDYVYYITKGYFDKPSKKIVEYLTQFYCDKTANELIVPTKKIYDLIKNKYPVFITRDYSLAKKWARGQVRGSQRCGVLASSGAQRLKPEGIFVPLDIDVENWFLAPSDDLRSSNMMEVVASEFKVQGLEIDWSVVCWDADLRRMNGKWDYYKFRGTKWAHRNSEEECRYLLNSYRVLLTRARQGMVIFVPNGVDPEEDVSRTHYYYDYIYQYLKECGIKELDSKWQI